MPKPVTRKKPPRETTKTVGGRRGKATRGTKNNVMVKASNGSKPPGKHMKRGARRAARY